MKYSKVEILHVEDFYFYVCWLSEPITDIAFEFFVGNKSDKDTTPEANRFETTSKSIENIYFANRQNFERYIGENQHLQRFSFDWDELASRFIKIKLVRPVLRTHRKPSGPRISIPRFLRQRITDASFKFVKKRNSRFKNNLLDELHGIATAQDGIDRTFNEEYALSGSDPLKLYALRMFNFYYEEDWQNLLRALKTHFGEDSVETLERSMGDVFSTQVEFNFGRAERIKGNRSIHLQRLSEDVDHIRIEVYRILPSFVSVTFDVLLSDTGINRAAELLRKKPKQRMSITSFYPFSGYINLDRADFSGDPKLDEYFSWLDKLCFETTSMLPSNLKHKLLGFEIDYTQMPTIEIYLLDTTRMLGQNFREWYENSAKYLDALRVDRLKMYKGETLMFSRGRSTTFLEKRPNHKLVLLSEGFKENMFDEEFSMNNVQFGLILFWRDFFPLIATLEFLDIVTKGIQNIRNQFVQIGNGSSQKKFFKLIDLLNTTTNRNYLMKDFEKDAIQGYQDRPSFLYKDGDQIMRLVENETSSSTMYEEFSNLLTEGAPKLASTLEQLKSSNSDYLQLLNVKQSMSLANRALAISVVALLISVWPSIYAAVVVFLASLNWGIK